MHSSDFIARLSMTARGNFKFWRTVYSHGWCSLPPFVVDKANHRFRRLLRLSDGTLVQCVLREIPSGIAADAHSHSPLSKNHRREVRDQIRACFRLDEDFSEFHAEVSSLARFRWIRNSGSARLLRAPTVFEDLVKMMCTTNCTWALTEIMVKNLTGELGDRFQDGDHAFPTPRQLASVSETFLRKAIKSGYRSPYLIELADRIASGKLNVESWRTSNAATPDLFKQILGIKGIGPYAAGNLLRLLGRYDYLALDSWVRAQYATLYHGGRKIGDRTIERAYRRYGKWRGLIFWFEMTRHWLDQKFPF